MSSQSIRKWFWPVLLGLAIVVGGTACGQIFLPASLVEGQGQFFLIRLAMPISISLAASLVVALVLIPLAVYLTLPAGTEERETSGGAGKRG